MLCMGHVAVIEPKLASPCAWGYSQNWLEEKPYSYVAVSCHLVLQGHFLHYFFEQRVILWCSTVQTLQCGVPWSLACLFGLLWSSWTSIPDCCSVVFVFPFLASLSVKGYSHLPATRHYPQNGFPLEYDRMGLKKPVGFCYRSHLPKCVWCCGREVLCWNTTLCLLHWGTEQLPLWCAQRKTLLGSSCLCSAGRCGRGGQGRGWTYRCAN